MPAHDESRNRPRQLAGLAAGDTWAAFACTLAVTGLFCLKLGVALGDLRQSLFLALFAVPVAMLITLVVELPVLHFLRKRSIRHPLAYVLAPGLTVFLVWFLPHLDPGVFHHLSDGGRKFITEGRIVWENIGWYALYHAEPALWACLAGLLFWLLRVRNGGARPAQG